MSFIFYFFFFFFFSSRRRHTRCSRDWSSDVCSSDLGALCDAPDVSAAADQPQPGPAAGDVRPRARRVRPGAQRGGRREAPVDERVTREELKRVLSTTWTRRGTPPTTRSWIPTWPT